VTIPAIRNAFLVTVVAVALIAGFTACFGDSPTLSITKSNNNVIITWPQTASNLVLVATPGLDHVYYSSNDVVYVEIYPRTIIPASKYVTNGANISVVLPIDSTNKFFLLQTNVFVQPPF
jgi:hypothetical protein